MSENEHVMEFRGRLNLPEGYGDKEAVIFQEILNMNREFTLDLVLFYFKKRIISGSLTFDKYTQQYGMLGFDLLECALKTEPVSLLNGRAKEN